MASLAAAALLWLEHWRALRSRGYSFRRFYRESARYWNLLLLPGPAEARASPRPSSEAPIPSCTFRRRDLRARW